MANIQDGSVTFGLPPTAAEGIVVRPPDANSWHMPPDHDSDYAMSTVIKPMTLERFLAWEEDQELRYEFDGVGPVGMTGGTAARDRISFNLHKALDARLAGNRCRPWGPNMKIITDGRARYPDAVIVCEPVPPAATILPNPAIVFEVLSESTTNTDLIDKNREYRATSSIQRYVILQQTYAAAIVFARAEPEWSSEIVVGHGASLHLPELGIDVPLAEIYANVVLREPSDG